MPTSYYFQSNFAFETTDFENDDLESINNHSEGYCACLIFIYIITCIL